MQDPDSLIPGRQPTVGPQGGTGTPPRHGPFLLDVDYAELRAKDEFKTAAAEEAVRLILKIIGDNPNRDGLKDTPARVVRAYKEMFKGYHIDIEKLFTSFQEPHDQMVVLKEIEFTSYCEHHMLPFSGKAAIGYVPNGRIIGVSKLARLLDAFTHRLQVQERICHQVTKALDEHLKPLGSACLLEAKHDCMICRGVKKQNAIMVTSSLTGVFLDANKPAARAEFFACVRGT